MLWKDEVVQRGIVWAAIWDNERMRHITLYLRIIVWNMFHQPRSFTNSSYLPKERESHDFSSLIRKQVTPPRVPNVKQHSIIIHMMNILTGQKN